MGYGTQSLHRIVQRAPHALGSIDGTRQRDWATVASDVARFAGALRRCGVKEGDRVALLSRNSDRYIDYVMGCFWAGAVIIPVNTRWSAAEIAFSLRDCGARLLFVEGHFAPIVSAIRAQTPDLAMIVQIDGTPSTGVSGFAEWLAGADPIEDSRRGGDHLAAILYTGGTTGHPKGVMLSHANLLASANGYLAFPGARPGCNYLHVAPLFHIGALSGLFTSMLAGSTQIFLPAFAPADVIDIVARERVSDLFLVPTMLRAILLHDRFAAEAFASVERIVYGASPIDDALLDRALELLPNVAFVQAYGMTELSPIATMLGPEDHGPDARAQGRGRSAGRATTATEVRIVDADDREVPRGQPGEIVARGAGVMLGYWSLPEDSAQALRGGWMHTGDVGWMDAAGYVTVIDRLKDVIVSGGENVYSAEVENALATHPAVQAVAVIGSPDPIWGEAVHAVIVPRDGATIDRNALCDHARARIAGYKLPKRITVVETLPLSPAGKVLKSRLREIVDRGDDTNSVKAETADGGL